jgi:hypothetical protein
MWTVRCQNLCLQAPADALFHAVCWDFSRTIYMSSRNPKRAKQRTAPWIETSIFIVNCAFGFCARNCGGVSVKLWVWARWSSESWLRNLPHLIKICTDRGYRKECISRMKTVSKFAFIWPLTIFVRPKLYKWILKGPLDLTSITRRGYLFLRKQTE